ncbi:MAG: hypothetical protein V4564_03890 [Pseudomonadota bacterium]|uniref:hypothetical protein n=1 Tax=Sphingomonas sp. ERG5 TaxID=1381597 RepID=UPI00054C69B5|nr:hypothetical protein [Sphingomonas sp. ERG5]
MGRQVLLVLAGGMLMATTPAVAKKAADPNAGAAQAGQAKPQVKKRRYCERERASGNRIDTTTCLNRQEWLERGVDPLQPQ